MTRSLDDVVAAAVRDALPVAASIAPFSLVIGATGARTGVPALGDMAGAALVFAGAAHLATLTILAAGAGALTALGTAVLINVRLLLYSASMQPRFVGQPRWFRWLGPLLLIDQTYLMVTAREDLGDPARFRRYWLYAGGLLMTCWVAAVALGAALGPLLPPGLVVDTAGVAVLTGMLAPRLKAPRVAVVAFTALVVAAVVPGGGGLTAGIVAGVVVGALFDWRSR